ncbi:MAG: thiamine pyrophosphate-dependent enzyme [Gammaproteobacteria bacterium]|nr:thiamine pyrophosphate-dependent enzyme [Gammaproteobacteria bacterium]
MADSKKQRTRKVFVSSTRQDLSAYREAVIVAINHLKLNDLAMESFGAHPDAPVDVCRRHVRQSDMLVLIIGRRYGSLVPKLNKSFTQVEYEEAFSSKKECFVFFMDERGASAEENHENNLKENKEDEFQQQRLEEFRQLLLERHTVTEFRTPEDLAQHVNKAISNYLQEDKTRLLPEQKAEKQQHVLRLIQAYRRDGHQQALHNPLNRGESHENIPSLSLAYWDLTAEDLDEEFSSGSFGNGTILPLRDLIEQLRSTYCGITGWEYDYMPSAERKRWLSSHIESGLVDFLPGNEDRAAILNRLLAAQGVEQYLQRHYPGSLRFSLEGAETLLPLLCDLAETAGNESVKTLVLGTTHRGRTNLLVNLLGQAAQEAMQLEPDTGRALRFVRGGQCFVQTQGGPLHLILPDTPREPEAIAAVVQGTVRGYQDLYGQKDTQQALAIQLHGDITFGTYGAVYENLSLSQTLGFGTFGTIHIVVNNQIGFTASNPLETRSSLYCTEIAKSLDVPVFHVNADSPDHVIAAGRLALKYRQRYRSDLVIDLICYRRRGHHELDDPTATQPLMYRAIEHHPLVTDLYGQLLITEGLVTTEAITATRGGLDDRLGRGLHTGVWQLLPPDEAIKQPRGANPSIPLDTSIDSQRLGELGERLCQIPEGFLVHHAVGRIFDKRREMARNERPWDWGFAELCAFASILDGNYSLRLGGKDVARGSHFQRHINLYDMVNGNIHTPLHHISMIQAFSTVTSSGADQLVLAYEYGYASARPDTLVIWEAQFPDSTASAQTIIDQLILVAPPSRGQAHNIVLLVPYGRLWREWGSTSGRLEQFLSQQGSGEAVRVCVPSTPAQMFHLYRRQILCDRNGPLIVMVAPTLFHEPKAASPQDDFSRGSFLPLISEKDSSRLHRARDLILCSGESYYSLLQRCQQGSLPDAALVRIEQLQPFPLAELSSLLESCDSLQRMYWHQTEAPNLWAWSHVRNTLTGWNSQIPDIELLAQASLRES